MSGRHRSASDAVTDVVLRLVGAADHELDAAVDDALGEIAGRADAERGYVTFYDVAAGTFDISHEWTAGVVPHRAAIQNVGLASFPWSVGMAMRQEVIVVHDIDDLPPEAAPERESFGAFGVRSIVQVPIVVNGATVGIAGLNRFRPGVRWDDDIVEFLRRAGQAVGVALLRHRAARDVAAERSAADAARRSRDELLAHVSHELRTPLHAILGYAELLELDERNDHDRDALMRIQTNGRHLLAMIDDLAALARPSGAPVDTEPVDVAEVVGEIVSDLQTVATDRGLQLRLGDVSGWAMDIEAGRVRQVVRCMVVGAAQSMRSGTITVGARDGGDLGGEAALVLCVRLDSDHAIGTEALVLPIAQSLIAGRGTLTIDTFDSFDAGAAAVVVTATFDQAAARP